jgi:hypothetical protein
MDGIKKRTRDWVTTIEEAAVTNDAKAAIEETIAAIQRAAAKSMRKAALKDKVDDRQKDFFFFFARALFRG